MWGLSSLFLATWQFFTTFGLLNVLACGVFAALWILLICKWQWRRTGNEAWLGVYRFWVRFFALSVTLCFSVSIPLLIQVGTVWPTLLMKVVAVVGPILSLVVLLAFVSKLVFLNIMLYQMNRVPNCLHNLAILCAGLSFSAVFYLIFIVVAWVHEPIGTVVLNGIHQVVDWPSILMQPQIIWRAVGSACAGFAIQAFLMMGISAWQGLRRPLNAMENLSFKIGAGAGLCALLLGLLLLMWESLFSTQIGHFYAFAEHGILIIFKLFLFLSSGLLLWAGFWSFYLKKEAVRMPKFVLRLYSWFTFSAAILVFIGFLLFAQDDLPALVGETIFIADVFRDPGFWPLAFSTLAYLSLFIALLFGFLQMLYHAARFGVVPVRKIRRTA
ncbi:MAG: cytochrome ubiquinol oxidase subunit I [Pelistega sp.]|nr:cytochrome ubiquinol oxidase subunit I [Pelistega sp.]